ncbi:hypothetical protein C8F04DRAFT_612444 [Mycena alexandri]|uniref:Uncharacterized protein n=1 Tax=Mycena alexandri TaxID=1745969 RepID=A0AAD6STW3_9AGAR|nr:hypothetical protein C8F04DRAFT_612444 [Mycena alexandri]
MAVASMPLGRLWLTVFLLCSHLPLLFAQVPAGNGLPSASWIWTAQPTTGNVGFIKTFGSANGKTATSALFTISAVNSFTLWVNNEPVGTSGSGVDDWKTAQVYSAALNTSTNSISILAVNNNNAGGPAPGLIASIIINYSNGDIDLVVSDSSWGVSSVLPSDFPTVSVPAQFIFATVVGTYGSGSWGSSISIPATNPNTQLATLRAATWIWSVSGAASDAPVATVGFRKTVATPAGMTAQSGQILVAGDDDFEVYLNSQFIGRPPGVPTESAFGNALLYAVDLAPTSNVFTVFGINRGGPAGFAASLTIQYSGGDESVVGTDTTWNYANFTTTPAFLALPDSALVPSFAIAEPAATQLVCVSNALPAAKVPKGPFASGTVLPSSSPSASATTAPAHHSSKIGVIVGPIVGVLALVALGVIIFFCLRRRRDSRDANTAPPAMPGSQPEQQHPLQSQNYTTTSYSYPSHVATGQGTYPYPQSVLSAPGTEYSNSYPQPAVEPWIAPQVARTPISSKRSEMLLANAAASSAASTTTGTTSRTPPSSHPGARRESVEPAPPSYFAQHQ